MLDDNFFVDPKVEEKTITMADGTQKVLWFRHLTNVQVERARNAMRSADEDVRAGAFARLVAMSLCDADGKLAVDFETASRIKPGVMDGIVDAVLEINGLKTPAKPPAESVGNG